MTVIRVCALTFRRPLGLDRLLDGFAALEVDPHWDLAFIIVDNDPAESARARVEAGHAGGALAGRLRYVGQPVRGIARSRNAALDRACAEGAELIAFIDDDERPAPGWLKALVAALERHEADVVGGPVLPVIEGEPPAWIVEGGFFARRRYRSGETIGHVFTNNALFRAARVVELGLRFDERPRFAELGVGEDRLFFQALRLAGARTVWCDEALVEEWVPADRANATWLAERMRKVGLATALVERELDPSWSRRLLLTAKAVVWALIGCGRFLVAFGDGPATLRARRALAYARGLRQGLGRDGPWG